MKTRFRFSRVWFYLAGLFFLGLPCGRVPAAPTTIVIQGKLTGPTGLPLLGNRAWKVQFYDMASGGKTLGGVLSGTIAVGVSGRFVIEVVPPQQVLDSLDAVYYQLSIDSARPPDGQIGPSDVFAARVKVGSALWSQRAALADEASMALDTHETLSSVVNRNAVTDKVVTVGGLAPSAVTNPSTLAGRLLNTSSSLYWDGRPLMGRTGDAFVIVPTTSSPTLNGQNLLAAYTAARKLKPHGAALSTTNRAVVLVSPGKYDLGTSQLVLDTQYVDLAGLSSARADQYISGSSNGVGTGVLRQTASDVRIENLMVVIDASTPSYNFDSTDPAAYFPSSGLAATVIRNCEFKALNDIFSTRLEVNYSGKFYDCTVGRLGFGSYGGTASGTFINCTGGDESFASNGGTASGTFIHCTAGNDSFGNRGWASGTFTDCTGGAGAFGGHLGGTASGTFINCTGGDYAFGGNGAIANGIYINCTGDRHAFGGSTSNDASNTSAARLFGCRMTDTAWSGVFAGKMRDCHWSAGIKLAASARIYNSTFLGTLDLDNTAAGVAHCSAQSIVNAGGNCFGASAYNISDADVQ